MNAILAIVLSGYGFWYDGYESHKYYFEVNTPSADYGLVLDMTETPKVYCDVIAEKGKK